MSRPYGIDLKSTVSLARAIPADVETNVPHFRHTWSKEIGGMLDSTCQRCSAVIALNRDEIALLSEEREHFCKESKLTKGAHHD